MAKTILNGFRSYFADYLNSTLSAKARFEKADWHGVQQANVDRLELYKAKVAQTVHVSGDGDQQGYRQPGAVERKPSRPTPSWCLTSPTLRSPRRFSTRCFADYA